MRKLDFETIEALLAINVDPYQTTCRLYAGKRFCCDTPEGFKLLTAKQVQQRFGTFK